MTAAVKARSSRARRASRERPLSLDAEEFLSYLAVEKGRAPSTLESYRRDLVGYEAFLYGKGDLLSKVSERAVESYLSELKKRGLKDSSRRRALSAVRGLHGFCEDERGHEHDPTKRVESPRRATSIPRSLTEPEVAALLGAVKGSDPRSLRDRAILELLYATGLRISELVGLSLGDLDLEAGLLRALGKGNKERLVPFGSHARRALWSYLSDARRTWLKATSTRDDLDALFLSTRGRRMNRQAAWSVVHTYAKRAGLEDKLSPHVLRHSFATHLLEHGANIRVVQELLGHASITTTQIYTKVTGEHLRRAYDAAHPRAGGRTPARR